MDLTRTEYNRALFLARKEFDRFLINEPDLKLFWFPYQTVLSSLHKISKISLAYFSIKNTTINPNFVIKEKILKLKKCNFHLYINDWFCQSRDREEKLFDFKIEKEKRWPCKFSPGCFTPGMLYVISNFDEIGAWNIGKDEFMKAKHA